MDIGSLPLERICQAKIEVRDFFVVVIGRNVIIDSIKRQINKVPKKYSNASGRQNETLL